MPNLILALLLISSVAGSATGPAPSNAVTLHLERDTDREWHVRYQLPRPVTEVSFARGTPFRAATWTVVTEGVQLTESEGNARLEHTADGGFDAVHVRFGNVDRNLEKDYVPVVPFSGGDALLYTGHLHLAGWDEHRILLRPNEGEHVIQHGRREGGATHWAEGPEGARYVFVGRQTPLATDHMLFLVDAGVPTWLSERTRNALPRLFDHFSQALGHALPNRPEVYLSFDAPDRPGTNYKGGTLPGQVQLRLQGAGWQEESKESLEELLRFLAHEAAHLWNGELFRSRDPDGQPWIHEGGANALADRALLELGVIDADRYRARFEEALNQCAAALDRMSMERFSGAGLFQGHYACGSVFHYAIERAMQRSDPDATSLTFTNRLFDAARAWGNEYDADLFLQAAARASSEPVLSEQLRVIVSGETGDGYQAMRELMDAAGVALREDRDDLPEAAGAELIAQVVRHLLSRDCGGGYSFSRDDAGIIINGVPGCASLEAGRSYPVASIAGIPLREGGVVVHDAVAGQCKEADSITLGLRDGEELALRCPENLPARRPWLRIVETG